MGIDASSHQEPPKISNEQDLEKQKIKESSSSSKEKEALFFCVFLLLLFATVILGFIFMPKLSGAILMFLFLCSPCLESCCENKL